MKKNAKLIWTKIIILHVKQIIFIINDLPINLPVEPSNCFSFYQVWLNCVLTYISCVLLLCVLKLVDIHLLFLC